MRERRRSRRRATPKQAAELEKAWHDAIAEADRYVVPNEFDEIVDREGGVGLNASTEQRRDPLLLLVPGRTASSCGPTSSPSAS